MGCCASSHEAPATSPAHDGAPPPLVEKETVKEVLSSEIPKPKAVPDNADKKTTAVPVDAGVGSEIEEKAVKIDNNAPASPSPETSLVSEMCSLSDSVSAGAATVTDARDDDEDDWRSREIRQRMGKVTPKFQGNYRASPPGNVLAGRRQLGFAMLSPARRSEPSPNRGRSGSVRDAGQLTPARRGVPRRELGENYGRRRSMSPGTRSGFGSGRSPSYRKTGRVPERPIPAKVAATDGRGQAEESWRREEHDNDESFDNPLVSLECFIFL